MDTNTVRKTVQNVRHLAREAGRDPVNIRFIVGMSIIVDETDEKAQQKYEEYLSYADREGSLTLLAGWTGCDLGHYDDDYDLQFEQPGGITSVVSAFKVSTPGGEEIKWTKKRLATELALGGPHPKV